MSIAFDAQKTTSENMAQAMIAFANSGERAALGKVLFVDGNRTDTYIADGSMAAPYKTIAAANTAAVSGEVILVAPGTYTETVTVKSGVLLLGLNASGATLTGTYMLLTDTGMTLAALAQLVLAFGSTGGLKIVAREAAATLSGASTDIAVNIPAGAVILGCQLRVDVLITSVAATSWAAAYKTGATQAICTGQLFTKQVKADKMFDTNAATPIASATTVIAISANTGTFSAGNIRAITYSLEPVAMGNAA